ncbi:MAG: hypothetical protein D3916_15375 [Candidatus Electrothrix sp. MAN1_4]|nr:hypothetical protein [Candidatus Electrothrix sp. MAN1_4]
MRKLFFLPLTALLLFSLVNSATAAEEPEPVWCWDGALVNVAAEDAAEVTKTGAAAYTFKLNCLNPEVLPTRLYWVAQDLGDSGYATLMTALSLDQNIVVRLEGWDSGSLATKIVLKNGSVEEIK